MIISMGEFAVTFKEILNFRLDIFVIGEGCNRKTENRFCKNNGVRHNYCVKFRRNKKIVCLPKD
jgi:hypothetical protein